MRNGGDGNERIVDSFSVAIAKQECKNPLGSMEHRAWKRQHINLVEAGPTFGPSAFLAAVFFVFIPPFFFCFNYLT